MGKRRHSRELAMQALFYMDMVGDISKPRLELFNRNLEPDESAGPFFEELVLGVINNMIELDSVIERFSNNWKINRMACVDRNIIRIAVYEMLYIKEIPSKVSINEAIDIGKLFGTNESGAFINGILDSIRIAIEKKELKLRSD